MVSEENHQGMEIFGIASVVLVLIPVAATFTDVARDGRGHTSPVFDPGEICAGLAQQQLHWARAVNGEMTAPTQLTYRQSSSDRGHHRHPPAREQRPI
jgi:hypothetical protein